MWFHFLCLFLLISTLFAQDSANKRSWSCELISVESSTADENKLNVNLRIVRVRRGVFAFSGEIVWNYDVTDDTMVEYLAYRSATGGNDYKLLPFSVPKQSFVEFLNNVYKDVVMKNYANCSNLPQFEGEFEPPFIKKTYTFDHCMFEGQGMPTHMLEGFYKVVGTFYGEVQWGIVFYAKVTPKIV